VFRTEPAPVTTPQPSKAAWAKGIFEQALIHENQLAVVPKVEQANSLAAQARDIAWSSQCRLRVLALEGTARETSRARSARLRQRPYDVISDTELRDIRTDCCNDPRYLVTQHGWYGHNIVSSEQEVRMTEAGRLRVDKTLATHRRGDLHVLEIKSMTERVQDKCVHIWLQICDNLDRCV
jgi:hypothetical protein